LVADRRLELFEAIRRDARQGESVRELAERHGVHRRTVRQAIDSALLLGRWRVAVLSERAARGAGGQRR
jgi:hypothetical protein